MLDFINDRDGIEVLWEYKGGWLVYEYTGFMQTLYPERAAYIGHRCHSPVAPVNNGDEEGRPDSRCVIENEEYDPDSEPVTEQDFLQAAGIGFVSAEIQGKNICGWCNEVIPDDVHGVVALYNYGKEGEHHVEG